MKPDPIRLPETITVPRTDPIYNCHAYLTKVPIGAIQPFIQTFTEPGEVVADFFAGSGMTGLAALTLNRRARLSDISVLGKHIATGYLTDAPARGIRAEAHRVMAAARNALGTLYMTKTRLGRSEGRDGPDHLVVHLSLPVVRGRDGVLRGPERARRRAATLPVLWRPVCATELATRRGRAGGSCRSGGERPGRSGRACARPTGAGCVRPRETDACREVPSLPIEEDREMFSRSGLRRSGMTETGKFFSPRNGIALVELWRAINDVEDEAIRQELRFAFTAILPRASMRYQWSAKRPLNAQNQTYYIAPVYFEWNVFDLYGRKVNAVIRANEAVFDDGDLFSTEKVRDVSYEIASAEKLAHLDDGSVDYVFTDPPFGSNIFYSDMNLFQEAWLGETTDHAREAVVHTTGKRKNRSGKRYEELLRGAFSEAFRMLKPGRYMSVVFGNSSGRIWGLVQRALRDAGFKASPVHVAILDKGQRSVKGLNSGSEGVVTVDLIVTVHKSASSEGTGRTVTLANGDTDALIRAVIDELPAGEACNPSHVYARILRKAIRKGLVLDELHLGDVLIALRNSGYRVDRTTGLLVGDSAQQAVP